MDIHFSIVILHIVPRCINRQVHSRTCLNEKIELVEQREGSMSAFFGDREKELPPI